MSTPTKNRSVNVPTLSALELNIFSSPSSDFSCSSCSSMISRSTSSGLAPGQMVITETWGCVMSGVS